MSPPASRHDVEVLYRRHAGELHGYLYRRAGPDGTDLLSDVFVVALQRVNDLPEPDLRRAWLFGTARRLLLASARSSRKRVGAEAEQARLTTSGEGGHDELTERVRAVREALACLREPDRELIRLIEWEGLEIAEVATVLGIRPGTARVRLHRARRALGSDPRLRAIFEAPREADPGPPSSEQAISRRPQSASRCV